MKIYELNLSFDQIIIRILQRYLEDIMDVSKGNMDYLIKENVEKLPETLKSIYDVLVVAFEQLGVAKDANLVVAIGNTGSGKSTMLSSIIYGSDSLHETYVD